MFLVLFLKSNAAMAQKANLYYTYNSIEYTAKKFLQLQDHPAIKDSLLDDAIGAIEKCKSSCVDAIKAFVDLNGGYHVYDFAVDQSIVDLVESVNDRYPLFKSLGHWGETNLNHICEYIQMMEEKYSREADGIAA